MELQLLFLLLPVAALSGWWIGRRQDSERRSGHSSVYRDDYFRGLNFVINEQPDKAIEVFLRMVEVDSETVDTHFALASLFRRRGEVDRAIRIHQNLIARPTLTPRQRREAFFELARDYQSAGVLDRAEGLYQDLLREKDFHAPASRQLLDIYQQERDWEKALETAQRLRSSRDFNVEPLLAHYHCEIAEAALGRGEYDAALKAVRQAPAEGDGAVRASLLEGKIALAMGDGEKAIEALSRVEEMGPEFVPEILEPMRKAYEMSGREGEWAVFLEQLASRRPCTSVVLARCAEIQEREGREAAAAPLADFLRRRPTIAGVEKLIALNAVAGGPDKAEPLAEVAHRLMQAKPRYRCGHCGFSGRTIYWQCPGCKRWGTTKPIYGIEGE